MLKPYYQDEAVTIYNGNCLEIIPKLDPFEMVVTSPPYDNLRTYCGFDFNFESTAHKLVANLKKGG